jgi:hypothetical protein
MRKILGVAVLATALISGIAGPSFVEGDYILESTAIPTWTGKWPHAACQQFRPVRS